MTRKRLPAALGGSLAALAAATGLVYALRPIAPTLSLGVIYTLAVLATAVLFGIGFAVPVAVASMLAFNFLFLAPVHTLTLADGRNWAALAVYLATGVVASELAARARRRAAEAQQREREAALLSDVAAELLQVGGRESLVAEIRQRSERLLAGADEVARTRVEAAVAALLAVASERDRLEIEAREAEALRRSDAIKTMILQAVSHDFRTPLATISAAVGGLQSDDLTLSDVDRTELLETIRLEQMRLSRLVENLLDLSRLQAGAAEPHVELWPFDDLLAGALAEIGASARIELRSEGVLPAVRVDAGQMQRVVVNLIENALRFSPPAAAVEVRASVEGADLVVEVLDRGAGIDPSEAPALLTPFVRGHDARGVGGTGLGLAIAQGFASINDVGFELKPRAGGGTCALLRLPVAELPAGVAQ